MAVITMHKYQGLGNDYLVFDPNQNESTLLERKIRLLCQRNFGVGADGILYGPLLDEGKIGVSIFNPDGSEASGSGNGVRIFARYLKDFGYVSEKKFVISEKSKDVEVEFLDDDGRCMKVDMGKADFMRSVLSDGCSREMFNEPLLFHGNFYNTSCISLQSPNCVIMTEDVSCKHAKELGPYVENAACFPNRMNLQLCKVESRNRLRIQIYERGAGYTLASGTGACAAAAAAYRMGLTERAVTVVMPGGELGIEIGSDGTVFMTGTVKKVATFTLAEDFFS